MEVLTWSIGILVTIDIAVTGFLAHLVITHVVKCNANNRMLGVIQADVERMKEDIGTHDRGMRGEIHKMAQMVNTHELKIGLLERE